MEAVKREMYRVSQDDCMVFNPTDEDFIIEWEEWKIPVPNQNKDIGWGKGKREVKRYLADWYCRHMKNLLINKMGEKEAIEMLQKRANEGKETYTDKYVENNEIWNKVPRTNDPKLMGQIYPTLFLGVVREFGNEYNTGDEMPAYDDRTPEEKVMEQLATVKYVEGNPPVATAKEASPLDVKVTTTTIATSGMSAKEKAEFERQVTAE